MLRRQRRGYIGFSRMFSQPSRPWICHADSESVARFQHCPSHNLGKDPFFYRKNGTPEVFRGIRRYPCSQLHRNLTFYGAGSIIALSLSPFGSGRCFSYSLLHAYFPNILAVKTLVNLQRKECFFGTSSNHSSRLVASSDSNQLPDANSVSRFSRHGRIDAQKALFDYLHCTRSLHFPDAEHISKNSPNFLQKLLSKLDNAQDIGHSLTRFLRYHPINEFEPFFESLGLKPSELDPLLPRNLMFLTDDDVLLENYHVLCNYGVPRSKIGKIYKEGTEIFSYNHGLLCSKLQAYEELGLSKPTIIKLITCCPALLIGELNIDFLRVLEKLRSLGVDLDWLRGCLSDKSTYNWSRILEMLNFLDTMGCRKAELTSLLRENPRFVFDDSGRKIYVLVAMLLKLGFKANNILNLFVEYPRVSAGNFTKYLWRSVQFLSDIGMKTEDISKVVSSHPQVFGSCSCKKPESVLKTLNISAKSLCDMIKKDPSQFSELATRKKSVVNLPKVEGSYLQEKTMFLLKLGYVENSDDMAKALTKFRGRGDQLQDRFDCLVKAGLDCHTVSEMIRSMPSVLNQSVDVIEEKIDYLLNHLGYPLSALVAFPTFLCYSMEKMKLRFSMYDWLKEHGIVISTKNRKIVNSTVAVSTIIACSDERFVKYFVALHPEGPEVWERLKNSSSSKLKNT